MTDSGTNDNKKGKGFAALDTMVSDVSRELELAAKASTSPAASQYVQPVLSHQHQTASGPDDSHSSSSPGSALLWAIVAMVAVGILVSYGFSSDKKPSAPSSAPGSPQPGSPAARTLVQSTEAAPKREHVRVPSPAPHPATPPGRTTARYEQKPPEGIRQVLNEPQIRWCRREAIQMQAIKAVLDNGSHEQVSRFNAKTADYNVRCSNFQYYSGALEAVDRQLDLERKELIADARRDWRRQPQGSADDLPREVPRSEATRKPPIGNIPLREDSQIRWCVREAIKGDAVRTIVNPDDFDEVNRFNAWASDFNSRCRKGAAYRPDHDRLKRELEPEADAIGEQAKRDWARSS